MDTTYRSPKANAFVERWVRTVREECLDRLLIISERHVRGVLIEYTESYNHRRSHQGIDQRILIALTERRMGTSGPVHYRDVLGGIIHDYYRSDIRVSRTRTRFTGFRLLPTASMRLLSV